MISVPIIFEASHMEYVINLFYHLFATNDEQIIAYCKFLWEFMDCIGFMKNNYIGISNIG